MLRQATRLQSDFRGAAWRLLLVLQTHFFHRWWPGLLLLSWLASVDGAGAQSLLEVKLSSTPSPKHHHTWLLPHTATAETMKMAPRVETDKEQGGDKSMKALEMVISADLTLKSEGLVLNHHLLASDPG